MAPNPDALLTLSQAALAVGTYRQRVYKWVQLGRLVAVDTPNGTRYRYRDVLDCDADVAASPKSHPTAYAA